MAPFKVDTASFAVIYDQYVDTVSEKQYGIELKNFSGAEDVVENMKKQTAARLMGILHRADKHNVRVQQRKCDC